MTRPMFNARVAGFNKNGLVIVQLNDGSTTAARQTGNGTLVVGQPVVHQPGLSAGIAGVCYDPSTVASETKLWRPVTDGGRPKEEELVQPSGSLSPPPTPLPPEPPPSTGGVGNGLALVSPSGHYMYINQGNTNFIGSTNIFDVPPYPAEPRVFQRLLNFPTVTSFRWGIGRKTIFSAVGYGWYLGYNHPTNGPSEFFEYSFYISHGAFTPTLHRFLV
jgi:hypothetical protein